jgi:hypothetical protein
LSPLNKKSGGVISHKDMKKIGILYHPKVAATRRKAREMAKFLESRDVVAWVGSAWDREKACPQLDGTDLLLTVGGDDGKGWIDERAMLEAEVTVPGREPCVFHALNDVVMGRGEVIRLIRVEVGIDGQPLTTYKTDAIIMATATGSTGYALAARGPILYPASRDFILVLVAPHLSPSYPLVLSSTSEVRLRLSSYHTAVLSIDGHINLSLSDGTVVRVRRSSHVTRFLRILPRESFYGSLEAKLRGK